MTDAHPYRPEKPKYGNPCNGCGVCCQLQRCYFSAEIFGAGPGPCPALEDENGRAWCGVLRHPTKYMDERVFRKASVGEFQVAFAGALAISRGCDTVDGVLEEFKRRTAANAP